MLGTVLAVTPAGPASAAAPPAGQGTVTSVSRTCDSQDGFVDIGGSIKVKEIGKHAVTRLKVKWLLYNVDPNGGGIVVATRNKEQKSAAFPDDHRNFTQTFSQQWNDLVATDDGYTLIAKVTWERRNRQDWNKKYSVTYCS